MPEVDPSDDEIVRFVVRRYAYDPARRERRHIDVAAFDNEQEFKSAFNSLSSDLQRRRESGEDVDPREHFTGICREPGHRRRQQGARTIKRAIEHRATLGHETWNRLASDLPPGVAVVQFESEPEV